MNVLASHSASMCHHRKQTPAKGVLFFALATFLSVASESLAADANVLAGSADQIWNEIEIASPIASRAAPGKAPPDWAAIAAKARQFQETFPQDGRVRQARKLEITSELNRGIHSGEGASSLIEANARAFIQDQSNPATDRFDVSFKLKAVYLTRAQMDRQGQVAQSVIDTRDLIAEFPEDTRGYGYLLALAKGQAGSEGAKLAEELLLLPAPAKIKAGAQRLIAQRKLVGQPLRLSGVDLSNYLGKPLVIYSWTAKRADILKHVERLEKAGGAGFLGINLDQDPQAGRDLVRSQNTPGIQLYHAAGMDGGPAAQLHLTMNGSFYLIDAQGVVRDVSGYENTAAKLAQLTAKGVSP